MRLFTWDKDGQRVWHDLPCRPYLYVEPGAKQRGDKVSIFKTNLRKKEFGNEYRRREYIKDQTSHRDEQGPLRIFESISAPQQFLVDQYGPDGLSRLVKYVSNKATIFQSGYLYHYAIVMLIGFPIFLTYIILI